MKSDRIQLYDYNLIANSYHEASHIICALHNYFKVYSANVSTIEKDVDNNTNFYSYDEPNTDEELKKVLLMFELQVMYSGMLGERIYYCGITGSTNFPMHLKSGSSYDFKHAQNIIRKNNLSTPGKKTQLLKKQIQFDVQQILNTYWEDVKLVAHLLYRKKKLAYSDLTYTLSRMSENKTFWKDRFRKIKIILSDTSCPKKELVKEIMLEDLIFSI